MNWNKNIVPEWELNPRNLFKNGNWTHEHGEDVSLNKIIVFETRNGRVMH